MNLTKLPEPFLALAPMDDVTDSAFRQVIASCAKPDLSFTEFVNVDGLQSPGRPKLLHKLSFTEVERPIFAQLWGLRPENFYKTTKEIIKMGFSGVDLNMGCPVKTVIKNGACGALMNNHQLAGDIIIAVREAAGKDFPVSVKTRVGFTTTDLSWLKFLLNHKLDLLTVHFRTVKQMSKTPADWSLAEPIVKLRNELCPATKLVGNGDVKSRVEALKLAEKYNLDGVMIGRGVLADPFLFSQDSPWESWDKIQKLELFKKHIEIHQRLYKHGERKFETLRKFCKLYINGFEGAAELRAEFMQTETPTEALALLSSSHKL